MELKKTLNFNTVEFNTNSKVKALYNDPTIEPANNLQFK